MAIYKEQTETDRVRKNSSNEINNAIDQEIAQHVNDMSNKSPEAINKRIRELEQEWDVERNLEVIAPSLILGGLALGSFVNKKWLILPGMVAAFLLQHGIQGWCPPVPVLRFFGVRTKNEIDREKYALKALKGDFEKTASDRSTSTIIDAVNS